MKVAQLVMSRQFRGAEVSTAQLSKELKSRNIDVRYIAIFQNVNGKLFTPVGIDWKDLAIVKTGKLSFSVLKKLSEALAEFDPDIVQANAGDTLKYAVLVKTIFRRRYSIVFRNASTVSKYIKSFAQKAFNSFLYLNTDYIISVSVLARADFERTFPFTRNRITVIPNGITMSTRPDKRRLDKARISFIHVGGFTFEKNHLRLIAIFNDLIKSLPNAELRLIGEGPLKSTIEQEVIRIGLGNKVTFLGSSEHVLDLLAESDVLFLPSIVEGLPGVILEAFYVKTPVVAYNVGGISEVVRSGSTGWLVGTGDEEAFKAAVLDALYSKDLDLIKENAFNMVVNQYDMKVLAKNYISIYGDLVSKRHPRQSVQ